MFTLPTRFKSLLATALFAALPLAHATTSYGDIAAPGVVFGSGNVNGNFTIDTTNGVELALRAKNFGGATINGSSGVYTTSTGIVPGRSATSPRALWNYEFTINTGDTSLADYAFQLGVDRDPTAGTDFHYVNPLIAFGANGNGGFADVSQNSENVIFGSTPGGAFNPFQAGVYDFTLTATNLATRAVSRTSIQVDVVGPAVVPEPASLALMGLGLAGVIAARRKRAKAAKA